eukprot:13004269-Alexandrium_andersonii.AAC.1
MIAARVRNSSGKKGSNKWSLVFRHLLDFEAPGSSKDRFPELCVQVTSDLQEGVRRSKLELRRPRSGLRNGPESSGGVHYTP